MELVGVLLALGVPLGLGGLLSDTELVGVPLGAADVLAAGVPV